MRNLLAMFVAIFVFVSCNETLDNSIKQYPIGIYAEVSGQGSRTETDNQGGTSFVEGDCIGMFTSGSTYAGEWTFDGQNWIGGDNATWENKEDEFEFLAFYPCTSGKITSGSVPMPDLALQSGRLSDIGLKDFLVGRCTTSYSENNGMVSFSGSNSFKHIYSLIHLNIICNDNQDEVLVSGCKFRGEGISVNGEYVFGSTKEEDAIVWNGSSIGTTIEVGYPSAELVAEKFDIAVLVNPVSLDSPLEFSLYYEKDGIPYVASVGLSKSFAQGSYNKIKLNWVKDKLTIQGNEVEDWNVEYLDIVDLLEGHRK